MGVREKLVGGAEKGGWGAAPGPGVDAIWVFELGLSDLSIFSGPVLIAPGIERIDIDPNGKGCTKVWVNTEVASNMSPKLSTRTGLIYTQNRKYDAERDVYAVYWVALDFRTGKVIWEKLAGTFNRLDPATFDNFWAATGIGPNGALYSPQYGGVTMLRDSH